MGKNLAYGYPFFRKGFENLNCTDFVPMHKLITLLLDVPESSVLLVNTVGMRSSTSQ